MPFLARKYDQKPRVRVTMAVRSRQTKQNAITPILRNDHDLQATTRNFRHGMMTTAAQKPLDTRMSTHRCTAELILN